ncbi:hypothetical protein Bca4012_008572 [Brassica carinata]|uniref:Uncharacterized protein n=1 Tax=Brassica carinata TaxID=52824 RepID=A0A8X7PYU5_BRACI|nr:hypothetical protein Bca52824_079579 [Brassica carinata]
MLRIERVLIDRLSGHFLRRTAFPVSNRLCRNSDLSRRNSSSASSSPSVRSNLHLRRDPHAGDHSRTSFGYDATVHDYGFTYDSMDIDRRSNEDRNSVNNGGRRKSSADDVWKEILSGEEEKKTVMKDDVPPIITILTKSP